MLESINESMVLQVLFPDQTRVWSWYKRGIADLLVFEHAEEVNGKVSAAMQNQTVCSEDNTVDITGCQPLEVHAGRSSRIIHCSGGTWSRPCPRPMHVRFLLTTSTFIPVTTSITFSTYEHRSHHPLWTPLYPVAQSSCSQEPLIEAKP